MLPVVQYVKIVASSICPVFQLFIDSQQFQILLFSHGEKQKSFLTIFDLMSNTTYKITVETIVDIIFHRGLPFPLLGRKDWTGLGLECSFS